MTQEAISIICIMLGVVILTAWIMWLLLRKNGEDLAMQFDRDAAKDQLTRGVMHINTLQNENRLLRKILTDLNEKGLVGKDEIGIDLSDVEEASSRPATAPTNAPEPVSSPAASTTIAKFHQNPPVGAVAGRESIQETKPTAVRQPTAKIGAMAHRVQAKESARPTVASPTESNPSQNLPVGAVAGRESIPETKSTAVKSSTAEIGAKTQHIRGQTNSRSTTAATTGTSKRIASTSRVGTTTRPKSKPTTQPVHDTATHHITSEQRQMEIDALDREIPAAPQKAPAIAARPITPEKDDLTQIKGVGPKLAERLNRLGITRYKQIAILRDQDLDKVNDALGMVKGRIHHLEWRQQAQELATKR